MQQIRLRRGSRCPGEGCGYLQCAFAKDALAIPDPSMPCVCGKTIPADA
jgi:hypothetical protein